MAEWDYLISEELLKKFLTVGGLQTYHIRVSKAPENVPNNLAQIEYKSPVTGITYKGLAVKKEWM